MKALITHEELQKLKILQKNKQMLNLQFLASS